MFINKSNFKKVMQWHGFISAANGTWREATRDDRFMARVFLTVGSLLKHLGRFKSGLSQEGSEIFNQPFLPRSRSVGIEMLRTPA